MLNFLKSRTNVLRAILIFGLFMILGKLFFLQVMQHDHYVKLAAEQQTMQTTILARRGEIYLLDNDEPVVVAMNAKVWTVVLDPQIAEKDKENIEKKITEYAGDYVVADWNEVFKSNILRYFVIARNVPYTAAQKIKDENLPGVWMQGTTKRIYPEGTMAANLLGFVNADGIGQYGVEGGLNKELSGENGILKTTKDVNNIPLTIGDENVRVPAKDGKNIVLTVDREIQYAAEKIVRDTAAELGVANATAVVMNPQNGQILALAQTPTYDPADYGNVPDASIYQIDSTMGLYEPGSVCKTFAFSAAINEGKMTDETTYYNTDITHVDGWPITNASLGHTGNITMRTALAWSLNTGSVQALRLLGDSQTDITYQGKERLFDYFYNRFRLGQFTGVEIPEADGLVYEPKAADSTYANMTFGQGLALTALQVLAAFSSVVNGGDYYQPTVVVGEMVNDHFVKAEAKPALDKGVITEKTSATMRSMLHDARMLYANAPSYDMGAFVGGKTGTAQKVDAETGAYVDADTGDTIGSYVGFGARTGNDIPEYVIVTKIWENGKSTEGGTHAKPLFDRLSQFMIRYLKWV